MKLVLKFVFFLNVLAALCSLMAYISPYVDPSITGIFSFFGLGFAILLFSHLIFIIFWLIVKPKKSFLSLLILIAGSGPFLKTVGFNKSIENPQGLSVMSYNIGYSRFYLKGKKSENKLQEFKSFIKNQNADVICIQERAPWQLELYKEIFSEYTLYPDEFIGTAIYSKLPIVDSGNIAFDTKAHNATWIDVKYQNKIVRVYSVHLSSNRVKNLTDNIKEIWDESIFILDRYNAHAILRLKQLKAILAHADNSPFPVIISGDFNDIPQSHIYKIISDKYCDVFLEKGQGLGKTFMSGLPGLRIDYTFISKDLKTESHHILDVTLSDHYPILTTIGF